MRIVVIGDSLALPLTGLGYYTARLTEQFCNILGDEKVSILYYGRLYPAIDFLTLRRETDSQRKGDSSERRSVFTGVRQSASRIGALVFLYQLYLRFRASLKLRGFASGDVLFCPSYSSLPFPGKTVVTIADLSTLRFADFHPRARVRLVNKSISKATKRAHRIVAMSHTVGAEIESRFPDARGKVSVIYLGADAVFRPRSEKEVKGTLERFGLDYRRYFISNATLEPRKNLESVISAYERYVSLLDDARPLGLVITGYDGWHSRKLADRIAMISRQYPVLNLGYVDRATLAELVAGSRALFYLSLYEGFGLPVLEAMRSKTLVVTSLGTSMEEFAGEHALVVEPKDVPAIAELMRALTQNPSQFDELVGGAFESAGRLTWHQCALDTLKCFSKD